MLFDFHITARFNLGVALVISSIFLYGSKKEQLAACADSSTWRRPAWMSYVPKTPDEEGQLLEAASDEGSQLDEESPAVSRRKLGSDAA